MARTSRPFDSPVLEVGVTSPIDTTAALLQSYMVQTPSPKPFALNPTTVGLLESYMVDNIYNNIHGRQNM